MKIVVFSTPRTCSTFLCSILSNKFNIVNYNESIYSTFNLNKYEKIQWLKSNTNYVVKLFAKYFFEDLYIVQESFDWNMFDYVFITERHNLTDQMASVYDIWHNGNTNDWINFEIEDTIDLYARHKNYMQTFYNIKKYLLENHKSVHVIEYEKLQTNPIEYLNTITDIQFLDTHCSTSITKSNINYKEKYTNYNQLKTLVDNWNLMKS